MSQENKKASGTVTGQVCLTRSLDLLGTLDLDTSSVRTSQLSFLEVTGNGLAMYSQSFPASGIVLNGKVYQRKRLELGIKGIGSGLFATPNTLDGMPPKSEKALMKEKEITRPGRSKPANLRDQVTNMKLWATPRSCSAMAATITEKTANARFPNLETQVARTLYPTPCSMDYKGARTPEGLKKAGRTSTNSLPDAVRASQDGQLNPQWVEWLMGFPEGWTDLKD